MLIDPETRDLVFDDTGSFKKIFDTDTTIQNVRHALLTWKAEFFADREHGTDYERIMGVSQNDLEPGEVEEVIREAVSRNPKCPGLMRFLSASRTAACLLKSQRPWTPAKR